MSRLKAEIILFVVATIWAVTFPLLKITMAEFPPFLFVGFRFLIAAILFSVIFYKKFSFSGSGEIWAGVFLGVMLMIGFTTQSVGLQFTSSSNSALVTGLNVLFVPFAQYLIIKRKVFLENWIGVLLVVIGLYLLTSPGTNGINIGDFYTLICAFTWAFYVIYLDVFSNKYKNIYVMILIQFWIVAVLSFIVGFTIEDTSRISFSTGNTLTLLYTAVFATLIATSLGNYYQKYTSPVRASLIFAWETPAAVVISIFMLREQFKLMQISGAILMLGGILFSEIYYYLKRGVREKEA